MRARSRFAVAIAAAATTLAFASVAWAPNFWTGYISPNQTKYSGYAYWFAAETYKGCLCSARLGFQNSVTNKGITNSGGYMYVDKNMLNIGGYMRAFVTSKQPSVDVYHTANVCVC